MKLLNSIKNKTQRKTITLRTMEIWLIDDDPIFNLINKRLLNKYRPEWNVRSFNEAKLAIQELNKQDCIKPDLLFLDINMPEMDGWEFLEEVSKYSLLDKNKNMVLMHTSSIDSRDFEKSKSFELVKEYTLKPMEWDIITSILSKYNMNC